MNEQTTFTPTARKLGQFVWEVKTSPTETRRVYGEFRDVSEVLAFAEASGYFLAA